MFIGHLPAGYVSAKLLFRRFADTGAATTAFVLAGILGAIAPDLDTIVGDIWWLAPFIDKPYALFTVPAVYRPWWPNFVLYWSFALEIAIAVWALLVWRSDWK
ncbi:hypothetical protein Q668_03800 [Alcanivorax sp. PN-3]|jgi:hypothetical protein|uniref:hypothetical protein n=1 Tax=Alloalcanivorax xenomutans TaxID=1094342 RepID=UPI0003B83137|nr:hypothetical protein [Alloalcanivorax xenomutans]ERS10721.1 hypothetical protein Q668_03800 [Alcanivorax sp. PN-3]CUR46968.1 hypothetical protein BN2364_2527 [Alloalcanivorax xenomutans]